MSESLWSHSHAVLQVFVESVDLEELLAAREEERQEQDQVFTNHSDQFHAKFGSPETIYNQARQAASDYLAESGVEDLDEEEQEAAVAEALSEEEVDDAPGMLPRVASTHLIADSQSSF